MGKLEPSIDNLVNLIFGLRSNIGHLLGEKLKINGESLSKNLESYFPAAAYNLSQNQIYSKHLLVNTEELSGTPSLTWAACLKGAPMFVG